MSANKIMIITTTLIVVFIIFSFLFKSKPEEKKINITKIHHKAPEPAPKPKENKRTYTKNSSSRSTSVVATTTEEKSFDPVLDFMVNHKMSKKMALMTIEFQSTPDVNIARDALDEKNYSKAEILFKKLIQKYPNNLLILLAAYGGLKELAVETSHPNKELFMQNYYSTLDQYVAFMSSKDGEIPSKDGQTYNALKRVKSKIDDYYQNYEDSLKNNTLEQNAANLSNTSGNDVNLYYLKKSKESWDKAKNAF